jgi:hypothetical protein
VRHCLFAVRTNDPTSISRSVSLPTLPPAIVQALLVLLLAARGAVMRLWRWFVRWLTRDEEAEKLARCAQRHAIEQQIHATHD